MIVENYKDYLPVVFKEDDDKYKNNTLSLSEDGKIIYQATLELDMEKVFGEKIKGDVTFHGNSNKFRYSTTIKESEENKQIRYTTTIKEQEQK